MPSDESPTPPGHGPAGPGERLDASRRSLRPARPRRTRAWLLAGVLTVVVVAGAAWALVTRGDAGAPAGSPSGATPTLAATSGAAPGASPTATSGAAVDPPAGAGACTPEEPCLDPVATVPPRPSGGGERAEVAVTVSSSGWDAATASAWLGGFVDGVEEDATCNASFERDGETVVAEAAGAPDAATTVCVVTVPGSRLASGTWTATLEFVSAARSGTSAPVTMEIP